MGICFGHLDNFQWLNREAHVPFFFAIAIATDIKIHVIIPRAWLCDFVSPFYWLAVITDGIEG